MLVTRSGLAQRGCGVIGLNHILPDRAEVVKPNRPACKAGMVSMGVDSRPRADGLSTLIREIDLICANEYQD